MKIGIITCAFSSIPPYAIGAVEKVWFDLANEFVKKGHEVTFYAKSHCNKEYSEIRQNGVNVVYLKGYDRPISAKKDTIIDAFYSFRALLKVKKCDILVCNTKMSPILSELFRYKFKASVYNVCRYPKGQFKYYLKVDRLASCATMITNAVLEQEPRCAKNIKTLNNPVNLAAFTPSPRTFDKQNIRIVFTGRIHEEKGLINLAKAVNGLIDEYPNIKLTLVGTYDIERGGSGINYLNEVKSVINNKNFEYLPATSSPMELAKIIANSDIYCYPPLPTTGDAMPCAPLEALAMQKPVVVSDLPCFNDYITIDNGLRFNVAHDAVKNLQEALLKIINDEKYRDEISLNGVNTSKQFDTDKIADLFLNDFSSLITK